jgi:iron complex transport system ATP-binding protein
VVARLELQALQVRVPGATLLHALSLRLEAGQLVGVVGPNGAGKSTLLRALAGLLPAKGEILIDGGAASRLSQQKRAQAMAYLPQGHGVHWPLSVQDVVALGRYPHGLHDPHCADASARALILEAMARADVAELADRSILSLSGGEKARVMIARVLASQAPILLADEPMAALDPSHQLSIMARLREEAARGALVLVVTHDLGLAARFCDQLILLDGGALIAKDIPARVLTPEILRQIYKIRAYHGDFEGSSILMPWENTL